MVKYHKINKEKIEKIFKRNEQLKQKIELWDKVNRKNIKIFELPENQKEILMKNHQ